MVVTLEPSKGITIVSSFRSLTGRNLNQDHAQNLHTTLVQIFNLLSKGMSTVSTFGFPHRVESGLKGKWIPQVKTISDWLSANNGYAYHQEMTERAAAKTGGWFVHSDEFRSWQREDRARLWVTGMRESPAKASDIFH